jgi:hypothetical protein
MSDGQHTGVVSSAPSDSEALAKLLDRQEIEELIRLERFWRDRWEWDKLADCYTEDSRVKTTWFEGSGKDFAEASRVMAERGRRSVHLITPTVLRINGDRALSESLMEIHGRNSFDGVPADTIMYGRFFSRVRRTVAGWRLVSFDGIYTKTVVTPVNPNDTVPIDWEELSGYRPSYALWAYMLTRAGYPVTDHELGDDRPDLLDAFYRAADHWLETGELPRG